MGMRAFSLDLEAHVLSLTGEGGQLLTNHATQGIVDQGLISDRAARLVGSGQEMLDNILIEP